MSVGGWIAALLGFAIVVFVLWRYAGPPVRKMMNKEQESVRQQLRDSEAATERLKEAEAKYRDAIASARTEAAKIRDTARADAQRIVEEMRERADREVERIRQSGEEQLVTQREQIIRELHGHVGELSTSLATRLVEEHVADDSKREATVDRFLDELEGMSAGGNGGQQASKGEG